MRLACLTLVGLCLFVSACARTPLPLDLLRAEDQLLEAKAGGQDRPALAPLLGAPVRINDVVRRTLPAGPPGRLRFAVEVPRGGRLDLACAIPEERHDRPGVEFVVTLRRNGREETLWTRLVNPVARPQDRGWVKARVDLAGHAGPAELILETRGYETDGGPGAALWGTPALTVPGDQASLVVLYLVDALRADHTGPYGYARDTTPHLDAFARKSVVFEAAIAQASWTKPSVASILTGLLPGRHRAVQLRDPLDPGLVTLAQMLGGRRFATGAVIANSVIYGREASFDRGWDLFAGLHDEDDRRSKLVNASVVVDAALEWLDSRRGLPVFLYVHTMDPHVPYAPPPPFDRKYAPPPAPGHPAAAPRTDYKEPLDRERMIAQYDGDVAYGDQEFGRFVRELAQRGLFDRALIVFTSDHGEEFLDHGNWLHGKSVYDELIRVPLIVKFPGQRGAGRRIEQQVQTVDILPTILESQGLPVPSPPAIAGRPLQSLLRGALPPAPAVSEISHRGFVAHGVRTEKDKYVRRFSPEDDEQYFDLVRDPKERTSVLASAPDRVRALQAAAEAAMAPNSFRHHLRLAGAGEYAIAVRSGGWIEQVEASGFGPSERYSVRANGRRLEVLARPRAGAPREVSFLVRPQGAPAWLEGTRGGRPLRPSDVAIAEPGTPPPAIPVRLPELESEAHERLGNLFAPPPAVGGGIQVWLTLPPGRSLLEFDPETRERFKALGYLGGN
jgi:arylsulfatase A-like enzyme